MERFWEVDFLRGISLIFMIFFNYSITLKYFGIYSVSNEWAYTWLFPRAIASVFLLLVGISLWISYSRNPS
ncbi:MAG: heparan-alpha-glucosaminide N-acetyltransferase domain-containing protein, partial [Candidatus Aenigmarchaeota archaeon]|nr:heparan-alpha-glucosaminide N-acetyltransferase domain-containing protein [Candidatus Aenigmarchaeota archaeon]MDI6722564.1 heparan-alpha-glucosaminide N-acetyltransferase domain-containing protein [Candidatus Aenigmarchaeota archaeon]